MLLSWSEERTSGGRSPDPVRVTRVPPPVPPSIGVIDTSLGVKASVKTKLSPEVATTPLCSRVRLQAREELGVRGDLVGDRTQVNVDRVEVTTEHGVSHRVTLTPAVLPS